MSLIRIFQHLVALDLSFLQEPPEATIFILLLSLVLGIVTSIVNRMAMNLGEYQKMTLESHIVRQEMMEAMKSGNKRSIDRAQKRQQELMGQQSKMTMGRMKISFFFMIPFLIIWRILGSFFGGITIAYPKPETKELGFINYEPPRDSGIIIVTPKYFKYTTKEAREVLKENFNLKDIVFNAGSLAGLISALYTNDINLFGKMIQDKLVEPRRAELIPNYLEIKKILIQNRTLGVGIAGAGPSIFGIINKKEADIEILSNSIKNELQQFELDYQLFVTEPSIRGVRIIE